jgi:hypothetical protein
LKNSTSSADDFQETPRRATTANYSVSMAHNRLLD